MVRLTHTEVQSLSDCETGNRKLLQREATARLWHPLCASVGMFAFELQLQITSPQLRPDKAEAVIIALWAAGKAMWWHSRFEMFAELNWWKSHLCLRMIGAQFRPCDYNVRAAERMKRKSYLWRVPLILIQNVTYQILNTEGKVPLPLPLCSASSTKLEYCIPGTWENFPSWKKKKMLLIITFPSW